MRAPIKWLKDYVNYDESPEVLGDRLTMAGIPVEGIDRPGGELKNIVTGLIREVSPHPNADRLLVCKLDIGSRNITLVTGAPNVRAGQVVPVALPGAVLAIDKEIQAADFRGVASEGMLCSAEELLGDTKLIPPEKREGIYILPEGTPVGQDIKTVMGLDDVVLEFELTANRADCFCVLGIAREVAALTGSKAMRPMLPLQERGEGKATDMATIEIKDPVLCPRFCARIFTNVKIGESPLWMQHRLQAAGMRPISNVVDVTNFVMLEMGQPMHAYDYNLLAKHSIIVRQAMDGEKLTTLDGVKRELNSSMLTIADAMQPVGLAGVMGGLATEISSTTKTVLLEAAAFYGPSIRRTSRGLGLRSEASGRFERGVDVAAIPLALDRAAQLLEEMGACDVVPGIIDVYPGVSLPAHFGVQPEWINKYLGAEVSTDEMVNILRSLEFKADLKDGEIVVTAPTWRQDVTGPADIAEEVARMFGYDKIPPRTPEGSLHAGSQAGSGELLQKVRQLLSGFGFLETLSFSFSHPVVFDKLRLPSDSQLRTAIPLLNPITDEFPILRTTLNGGLLDTVARNMARKNEDLKLYEVGATYHPESLPLTTLPSEPLRVAAVVTGRRDGANWCHTKESVDFFDVKGALESLMEGLGIAGWAVEVSKHPSLHPGKSADFYLAGRLIASCGELHPKVQEAFGINRKVYLFEMDLSTIDLNTSNDEVTPSALPKFPAIARDLAVVLPESVPAAAVLAEILKAGEGLMEDARLFDVYTGDRMEQGMRSLAFSLIFRSPDRTLTDDEVESPFKAILERLATKFNARLRS